MHRKLNLTRVICLLMGKTTETKPYLVNSNVIAPENPLLLKQAVTSKRNPST